MDAAGAAPSAADQLAAIAVLDRLLGDAGIDYWLFGGWAVDFWAGEVTREHDDIDVAARRTDADAIGAALVAAGWRHSPVADEVVGTRYSGEGATVEFTFVVDEDGAVVIPFPGRPLVWSAEPFGNERRELRGVRGRTLPLALMRSGKTTPREGAVEAAKDRADLEVLSRLGD